MTAAFAQRTSRCCAELDECRGALRIGRSPKPPADPYTGEPFRMKRADGAVVVYSVGFNRKDEQGERDPRRYLSGGPDDIAARAWDVPLRRKPALADNEESD